MCIRDRIYPVTTQRLAMQNVELGLKSIFKDGHQNNIIDKMQTRKRLYELVEYEKYNTPGKKIKESVDARKDKNFLIIVRTDANTVEGIDKTLERIKSYEDAGADMIFPEAMKDEKEFEKVRKISKGYLLANMTEFGKSKLLNKSQLESLGYNLVIYPVTTQRLAMQNVELGLKSIFKDGHQNNIIDKMQTRKRLYELVEYEKYNTPDKKITDFSTEGHE